MNELDIFLRQHDIATHARIIDPKDRVFFPDIYVSLIHNHMNKVMKR